MRAHWLSPRGRPCEPVHRLRPNPTFRDGHHSNPEFRDRGHSAATALRSDPVRREYLRIDVLDVRWGALKFGPFRDTIQQSPTRQRQPRQRPNRRHDRPSCCKQSHRRAAITHRSPPTTGPHHFEFKPSDAVLQRNALVIHGRLSRGLAPILRGMGALSSSAADLIRPGPAARCGQPGCEPKPCVTLKREPQPHSTFIAAAPAQAFAFDSASRSWFLRGRYLCRPGFSRAILAACALGLMGC